MHPVESLVLDARAQFSTMLNKQSTSVQQAMTEYKRRYGREPPAHFDRWFDLAQQHNFVLKDEFDAAMQSLQPFWGVPPSSLQTLCDNALANFPERLMRYSIQNCQAVASAGTDNTWFRDQMGDWLPAEWLKLLPNMTLAVNVHDEPTVCVHRDTLDAAMRSAASRTSQPFFPLQAYEPVSPHLPRFVDLSKQDAWGSMTLSCPLSSPARAHECKTFTSLQALSFIRNVTYNRDICEHCDLQSMQGFFFAPEHLYLTHSLVPIWSHSKTSSFNDIVFPGPYYRLSRGEYQEQHDIDWESKHDKLYWVGSTTGGRARGGNWRNMHRQRLAILTKEGSLEPIRLLREAEPGVWRPYETNMSEISGLFSTRVTSAHQCDPAACAAQNEVFGIGAYEVRDHPKAASYHRFLLDMDGNGFSGRFYRLLHLNSTVIKQANFQEWHDDHLIPWVHYVPVSTSFEELPEIVRFFAVTKKGQELSKQMASESKVWARKVLRDVDLQLVWLRMLMEYGRIMSPARDM